MSQPKLNLAFLWHQHQPYYKNPKGYFQMPWVRFHGVKDYLDMILLLKEFPEIKQNINFVPSLLFQIEDYVKRGIRDNIWFLTEKLSPDLNFKEKRTILDYFFMANFNTMIEPYNRYRELYYKKRDHTDPNEQIKFFSEQDFRDLQVWYNLTWVGMISRERPAIKMLFEKGSQFSEEDKRILLDEHIKILADINSTHRELWDSGQIELCTSPFYHPIMPLLIDSNIGKVSDPNINLPQNQFTHPEDAEAQLEKGIEYFKSIFGRKPSGIWPSEGSVSEEVAELMIKKKINWIATDEGVLKRSLSKTFDRTNIYQPFKYKKGSGKINLFFRDHNLSDAIGFVYSNWEEGKAVDDFVSRLMNIRQAIVDQHGEKALQDHVVSVILDGENCWEYYQNDGRTFLRKLYARLSEEPLIQTVTYSEFLKHTSNVQQLSKIHPGSWINSNFNIWIGSEEDNRAWDLLKMTRDFFIEKENEGSYTPEVIEKAQDQIYIAEGSDWCWWYGDEHSSSQDMEFDLLYRQNLIKVYDILGEEPPAELFQSIKHKHYQRFNSKNPTHFISPIIDGRSTHFFEWNGAAMYDGSMLPQSAMHQVSRIIDKFYIGFDLSNLYFRIDFLSKPEPLYNYVFTFKTPNVITVVLSPLKGVIEKVSMVNNTAQKKVLDPSLKLDSILEAAIPFKELGLKAGEKTTFQLQIKERNQIVETFPSMNIIEIEVPNENFDLREWSA